MKIGRVENGEIIEESFMPSYKLHNVGDGKWLLLVNDNVIGKEEYKDLQKFKNKIYPCDDQETPTPLCITDGGVDSSGEGGWERKLYFEDMGVKDVSLKCNHCHGLAFIIEALEVKYFDF